MILFITFAAGFVTAFLLLLLAAIACGVRDREREADEIVIIPRVTSCRYQDN